MPCSFVHAFNSMTDNDLPASLRAPLPGGREANGTLPVPRGVLPITIPAP